MVIWMVDGQADLWRDSSWMNEWVDRWISAEVNRWVNGWMVEERWMDE